MNNIIEDTNMVIEDFEQVEFVEKFSQYDIRSLNEDQKSAFELLLSEENVFLSGEAGTGKSYVLNCYLNYVKDTKKVIVAAPSGVAAVNIGGATLHSVFQLPFHPMLPTTKVKVPKVVKEADVIVVDEISMCRVDYFEYIAKVIEKASKGKKKIQLIVVGDFFQLPPVITPSDRSVLENGVYVDIFRKYYGSKSGFAFDSQMWKMMNFKPYILKNVIRQSDKLFVKNLNFIRCGDKKGVSWMNNHHHSRPVDGIYMCGTNAVATRINNEELANLPGDEVVFKAKTEGIVKDSDKVNDDKLSLKVGAEVMFLLNDVMGKYQNGSFGEIVGISGDKVKVKLKSGKHVIVMPYTWEVINYTVDEDKNGNNVLKKEVTGKFTQIPLKLAYAATIHKSQGQTYDSANIDPSCFAHGQLYVALSRVKSISSMHLEKAIRPRDLIVDESVIDFYSAMEDEMEHKAFTKKDISYVNMDVPEAILPMVMKMVAEYEAMYK